MTYFPSLGPEPKMEEIIDDKVYPIVVTTHRFSTSSHFRAVKVMPTMGYAS